MIKFTTTSGRVIDIDPFDQGSIDAARACPDVHGGVGLAVAKAVLEAAQAGKITSAEQLPEEFRRHLGRLLFSGNVMREVSRLNSNDVISKMED
jgi:hypothetical protein